MKKGFKIFLLIWPVLLITFYSLHLFRQIKILDQKMISAHGFTWQIGENRFTVLSKQRKEGELEHVDIEILGKDDTLLFSTSGVIDWDMFGGGFLKAMQVDLDPELEIVFWGRHEKGFFLDFTGNEILQVPFDKAQPEAKELAERWHQLKHMGRLEVFIMFIIAAGYYILYGIVKGVILFVRHSKRKKINNNL